MALITHVISNGVYVCVFAVVGEANGCYLPGGLDWKELLLVAKQHPGYYLCAIIKE